MYAELYATAIKFPFNLTLFQTIDFFGSNSLICKIAIKRGLENLSLWQKLNSFICRIKIKSFPGISCFLLLIPTIQLKENIKARKIEIKYRLVCRE